MHKLIINQTVRAQTPETNGDVSMTIIMIFIRTNISVTKIPTLPGYELGGIRKLNQLRITVIVVGIKTCATTRVNFLFNQGGIENAWYMIG